VTLNDVFSCPEYCNCQDVPGGGTQIWLFVVRDGGDVGGAVGAFEGAFVGAFVAAFVGAFVGARVGAQGQHA
jgi:hypothetical protein